MTDYIQLESGVVVPLAQFREAAPAKRPEWNEIATTADGRDITRGYVDALPLLPPQDQVLQMRAAGDYTAYDEVLRDDQVSATFAQRRLAVVSSELQVLPGGKKRRDKQAAEALEDMLNGVNARSSQLTIDAAVVPLQGFDSATNKMLNGLHYGFGVAECLWGRDGRHITLDGVKVRKQRRFGFAPDMTLRLLTSDNPLGEPLPPRKFWVFNAGADNDDEPYGLGLAHWLYWPVWFKRNVLKFWAVYLEKFGTPTALGKYPSNATPAEKNKLLQTLQAIRGDAGVIIPEGMLIELVEATRSGTADYLAFYARMDEAITKVVLGQTMTTENGSSMAQAKVHMDVRQDLVKADADLICESFNRGPARWLTDWNYPGAEYPRIERRIEDEPDLKPQAERDKLIFDMGYKPRIEYIEQTYGGEWEAVSNNNPPGEADGASLANKANQGSDGPAFAEGGEIHPGDLLADQLEQTASRPINAWLEQIRAMLDTAESLDEFRAILLEAYGHIDNSELADIMGIALSVAELAGQSDVADENP